MKINILLYDKVTALDAVGPYEVLSRLPGAEVLFVADRAGPVRSDTGRMAGPVVAQSIQLGIEYDPKPPYAAGSPATAPESIVAALRAGRDRIMQV